MCAADINKESVRQEEERVAAVETSECIGEDTDSVSEQEEPHPVFVGVATIETAMDVADRFMVRSRILPKEDVLFMPIACLCLAFRFHTWEAEFPTEIAMLFFRETCKSAKINRPRYTKEHLFAFQGKVLQPIDANIRPLPLSLDWIYSSKFADRMPQVCLENLLHATLSSFRIVQEYQEHQHPGGGGHITYTTTKFALLAKVRLCMVTAFTS